MRFEIVLRDLFFPPRCSGCGERLPIGGGVLCPLCKEKYELQKSALCPICGGAVSSCGCSEKNFTSHGISKLHKLFYYYAGDAEAVQNRLVYQLKHKAYRPLVTFLAKEMAASLPDEIRALGKTLFVTYAPRTRAAVRREGFDHMAHLSLALAKELGATHAVLLARRKGKEQKKRRGIGVRYLNMREAFFYCGKDATPPRRVLLIDDVATSGATLSSAAMTLHRAGVKRVSFAVLGVSARNE